ncbi:concanavalin A-like lectin/glucanase domain-containing protein [Cokeromyces recurvatus]|uniref:concanavalin A-like lectin/glucanase domain-containing protein n=1 Tax=Cokeromyces recurvatus TaxID=90255 RepID=UPI0022205A0F|nr:concanavalin A-like lectin/glucanase domain-containing protein [Cokeromyces recurvatus]KAI7906521.1 concanavalin A-like lectin/glucanase domain-containing protein [Cokeromyces recurvatus]
MTGNKTTTNSFTSLTPPKYPLYLKYTNYANLVSQQYHQQRKRSYHDLLEEIDLRLPHCWNKYDKSKYIEVGLNGYDLHYVGPNNNKTTETAGMIRTNLPIRPQCGIYYFEIHIVSIGKDGLFSIGFCTMENTLNKLPGLDKGSFGYHGHTGLIFEQSGQGKEYGPKYASGDVIGCGINFADQTAFFTKNGVFLGTAFNTLSSSHVYYPTVGLSTKDERITANFGQDSFLFDIIQYTKDQQSLTFQKIVNHPENDIINIKEEINQLVMSYLTHQGYAETADSLKKNIDFVYNTSKNNLMNNKDTEIRGQIRRLIMSGSIDSAIVQIRLFYPHLLEQHPDILFHLKTRKFLDILIDDYPSFQHQVVYEEEMTNKMTAHPWPLLSPPIHVAASGRRLSWAAIAATPSSFPPTPKDMTSKKSFASIRKAIQYGHELQEEYQTKHSKYLDELMELFGLLSYSDPKTSPLAHLLDISKRDHVASELNNAIQAYQNQAKISNLESIFKQYNATSKELALTGHGEVSLINEQLLI